MSNPTLPEDPTRPPGTVDAPEPAPAKRDTARFGLKVTFWAAVLALAVMSLLPQDRLPAITASIWDKAQHAGGFALLGVLGLWAHAADGRQSWRVLTGLMAFGLAIEFAQAATGWRHGDALDAAADAVGLALGWLVVRAFRPS